MHAAASWRRYLAAQGQRKRTLPAARAHRSPAGENAVALGWGAARDSFVIPVGENGGGGWGLELSGRVALSNFSTSPADANGRVPPLLSSAGSGRPRNCYIVSAPHPPAIVSGKPTTTDPTTLHLTASSYRTPHPESRHLTANLPAQPSANPYAWCKLLRSPAQPAPPPVSASS
jgi:hypothetical protein